MRYLIDGYNLMHAAGLMRKRFGPGGFEKARRALIGVLAGSLGAEAPKATVVFDARLPRESGTTPAVESHRHGHDVQVLFAHGAEGADAVIEGLVQREATPKQLTVVSSDSRVRAAATRRGAHALGSAEFWEALVRPRRLARPSQKADKPSGRAPRDREFWYHEFQGQISDEDLRELAGPFGDAPE